jgi:hypothetical protein
MGTSLIDAYRWCIRPSALKTQFVVNAKSHRMVYIVLDDCHHQAKQRPSRCFGRAIAAVVTNRSAKCLIDFPPTRTPW